MIFCLNEENLVTSYCVIGGLSGNTVELKKYNIDIDEETGEETKTLTGLVPADFKDNFRIYKYKYDGENYVEPTPPEVEESDLTLEKLNNKIDDTAVAVAEVYDTTLENGNTNLDITENVVANYELITKLQEEIVKLEGKINKLENGGN